jgi:hypothetical protein
MPRRPRATATVLLEICLAIGAVLAISGCGGGGGSTGASAGVSGASSGATGTSSAASESPTAAANPLKPFVILSECESLYERVYANTAREVEELRGAGSKASPTQRRELRAAETKHEQALEFCEEELEIDQVRGRRTINIAATCGQSKSTVDELRGELGAARLEEFDQRRPGVCARTSGGD